MRCASGQGDQADLVSVWEDGTERRAENFEVASYPAAKGSAAAYYPETNVLVPRNNVADMRDQPTSKGIVVRLEPAGDRADSSQCM